MAHIARRKDLIRDKARSVGDFFEFVGLDFENFQPEQLNSIKPEHIKSWQFKLEHEGIRGGDGGLSIRTVYGAMSKLSSFYKWAMESDSDLAPTVEANPVLGQLPKLGPAYTSDKIATLSPDQIASLLATMVERTKSKTKRLAVQGWRDLAITLHLLLTGRRRAEVFGLTWGDFDFERDPIRCTYRVKGGFTKVWDIQTGLVEVFMRRYLKEAGRLDLMVPESPIWVSLRDSPVSVAGSPLTASAYAKTLKVYGRKAGISKIWPHVLRHTFATVGKQELGSLSVMSEALGHKTVAITEQYYAGRLERVRDQVSPVIVEALSLGGLMAMIESG